MTNTNNMDTPMHPEGLHHFSMKALMTNTIRAALKPRPAREYMTPLPRELRPSNDLAEMPTGVASVVEAYRDRVDDHPPFYYFVWKEAPHDDCPGGGLVWDVIGACRGGRVEQEVPVAGYRPDISIYAPGADYPSVCIEVIHTSPPSPDKLRRLSELGVMVIAVNARENPQVCFHQPVVASPLTNPPCGRKQRKTVAEIDAHWDSVSHPFVGIKFWPSGAQAYMYGEHIPDEQWETGSRSLVYGEPEVRGLKKKNVLWPSVEHIYDPVRTRSISREGLTDYLMWVKARLFYIIHTRPHAGDWSPVTKLEANILSNCDELLHMIRLPIRVEP